MAKDLDVKCLSQLPSIEHIAFEDPHSIKVTLPVCCLSFYKGASWKPNAPAFLVFTDFTTVRDAAINSEGMVSPSVPRDYFFKGLHQPLDRERILTTSVPGARFSSVATELRRADSSFAQDISFQDKENCSFEDRGVFAKLSIYLKVYKGKLESNFGSLTLINNGNWQKLFPESDERLRESLVNLLTRFERLSAPFIFQRACQRLDIQSIIEPSSTSEPPQKIPRRATGFGLMYQQHASTDDTQAPISFHSQATNGDSDSQSSQVRFDSQYQTQISKSPSNNLPSQEPSGLLPLEQATVEQFLVTRASVRHLLGFDQTLEDINKGQIYELDVFIKGMIPLGSIFVKPYNRTLKITPFKLIVSDASSEKNLVIEFNRPKEICYFLNINEVEDAFDRLEELQNSIETILHHPAVLHRKFKLRRCVDNITATIYRPYWTALRTLPEIMTALPNQ